MSFLHTSTQAQVRTAHPNHHRPHLSPGVRRHSFNGPATRHPNPSRWPLCPFLRLGPPPRRWPARHRRCLWPLRPRRRRHDHPRLLRQMRRRAFVLYDVRRNASQKYRLLECYDLRIRQRRVGRPVLELELFRLMRCSEFQLGAD
ncbi:hypothetical protein MUK42_09066 [Musa troglodytarum]|uniref:Uncharacterized protein n=1 Tax=Musa troglodytarum TaxID=320322 RepID=A0A9E7JD68_9LILI|nr:hypothetical protein MUK42_09066 [Musa troglodytarum]